METKRKTVRFAGMLLALTMAASCAACNKQGSDEDTLTVTYNYNYDGAPAAKEEKIKESDVADELSAPERERYEFTGWYIDAACSKKFDFEEALYEDVTIYAGWKQTVALVTFDYNYDGAEDSSVSVNIGDSVSQPSDPEREGYIFGAWYVKEECSSGSEYDFSSIVGADMTLYAGWNVSAGDTVTVTYMWNYEGAPDSGVANKATVEKDSKTSSYKAQREGYYLAGWYTDEECTSVFNFGDRINENKVLYARWLDIYTFEAEYVNVTGVAGSTYSGGSGGNLLLKKDEFSLNASNGWYISDLYSPMTGLTFEITSDKAVSDAVVVLRLGAEYFDMTLTDDMFLVQVNGENLSYSSIVLNNVPSYTSGKKRAFENYTISSKVALKEGVNTIKLIVNNSTKMSDSGTLNATAPMVDCMYIYTDAALSWTPVTSNIKK